MNKAIQLFSHSFGFEKLSKYERVHLHEANIQSSAYMGFIGVLMEIWMFVRQTITKLPNPLIRTDHKSYDPVRIL